MILNFLHEDGLRLSGCKPVEETNEVSGSNNGKVPRRGREETYMSFGGIIFSFSHAMAGKPGLSCQCLQVEEQSEAMTREMFQVHQDPETLQRLRQNCV